MGLILYEAASMLLFLAKKMPTPNGSAKHKIKYISAFEYVGYTDTISIFHLKWNVQLFSLKMKIFCHRIIIFHIEGNMRCHSE